MLRVNWQAAVIPQNPPFVIAGDSSPCSEKGRITTFFRRSETTDESSCPKDGHSLLCSEMGLIYTSFLDGAENGQRIFPIKGKIMVAKEFNFSFKLSL